MYYSVTRSYVNMQSKAICTETHCFSHNYTNVHYAPMDHIISDHQWQLQWQSKCGWKKKVTKMSCIYIFIYNLEYNLRRCWVMNFESISSILIQLYINSKLDEGFTYRCCFLWKLFFFFFFLLTSWVPCGQLLRDSPGLVASAITMVTISEGGLGLGL